MAGIPLVEFPYVTDVRCRVCHPADQAEPPFLACRGHAALSGNSVQRILICDNCDAQEADFQDLVTKQVTWASYKPGV